MLCKRLPARCIGFRLGTATQLTPTPTVNVIDTNMSLSATQKKTLPTCGENGESLPARDKQRMVNLWKELEKGIDPDDEETKSRIRILVARTVRDRPDSAMKHSDAHLDLVSCDEESWY